jgi:eukaryotic-like serine/threonine-protein kinase
VDLEQGADLVDREPVDGVRPQDGALLGIEPARGSAKRLAQLEPGRATQVRDVRRVGAVDGSREGVLVVRPEGFRRAAPAVVGGPERHDPRPRAQRAAPAEVEELRTGTLRPDEELLPELLAQLVDELRRRTEPREGARQRLDDRALDLGDRVALAADSGQRERQVQEREGLDLRQGLLRESIAIDGARHMLGKRGLDLDRATGYGRREERVDPLHRLVRGRRRPQRGGQPLCEGRDHGIEDTALTLEERSVDCLDEQALLDFLAGRLDGPATKRAREHVGRCETCNALATDVIQGAAATVRATPPRAKAYELVPGAIVADRYRLVRPLGEGGMGVVWEAASVEDGTKVAIKLLKAFDAPAKRRFAREIAFASALVHPGLARVVDVLEDVEAGCPALVMELLSGVSLAERLRRGPPFATREVARIGLELAQTLAVVHEVGLVHRDVKPSNIQLLDSPDRPVILLDLGLAKAMPGTLLTATRLTRTGHAVGTPAYMAPEQLAGEEDIDARADIWSLGCVLYECASGRRPFAGSTAAEVLRAIVRGPPPAMEDLDEALGLLLRSMLAPGRSDRAKAAHAVAHSLARLAGAG